jgi:hypothetical protein
MGDERSGQVLIDGCGDDARMRMRGIDPVRICKIRQILEDKCAALSSDFLLRIQQRTAGDSDGGAYPFGQSRPSHGKSSAVRILSAARNTPQPFPVDSDAQLLLKDGVETSFQQIQADFLLGSLAGVFMRFGFRKDVAVSIFGPAPPQLKELLRRTVRSVNALCGMRSRPIALPGSSSSRSSSNGVTTDRWGLESPADTRRATALASLVSDAELMEGEREWAYISVAFDEVTNERLVVGSNERMAEMAGMRREELLARFADHDLELPLLEADWLACFLLDLEFAASKETHAQAYLRCAIGRGPQRTAALLRTMKQRHFDGWGRMTRVRDEACREFPSFVTFCDDITVSNTLDCLESDVLLDVVVFILAGVRLQPGDLCHGVRCRDPENAAPMPSLPGGRSSLRPAGEASSCVRDGT